MDTGVIFIILTAATPLLFAALGELVVERSGVLNLGVEGMMVMGAVSGFGAALYTGSPWIGLLAAIGAGMAMSLLFGFLTLTLVSNQVATGLALTLLGLGLSGQIGEAFVGQPGVKLPSIGGIDPLIPLAVVLKVRYACVLFGGACSGIAGGYLSLVYTPQWIENMTSGRGWIALALVVFASWLPWRVLLGAYLFGTISILSFVVQTKGWGIPAQFLNSLPYLVTIVVLVIITGNRMMMRKNTPASLGRPFVPDR